MDELSIRDTQSSVGSIRTESKVKEGKKKGSRFYVPPLSEHAPQLLVFRARSKVSLPLAAWEHELTVAGTRSMGVGDQRGDGEAGAGEYRGRGTVEELREDPVVSTCSRRV